MMVPEQSDLFTVAYMAQLMIHRYAMLGVLTQDGCHWRKWG